MNIVSSKVNSAIRIILLTGISAVSFLPLHAQTIIQSINSGPSFKAFQQSAIYAGPGWNTLSYNDASWPYAYNGGGSDGLASCLGPNSSIWGGNDTCIWSMAVSISPDTGCLRKIINLPCGRVVAAAFSICGDDFYTAYINGNLLGSQPTACVGVNYTLSGSQLAWFTPGNNIMAFEIMNTAPDCGKFAMIGTITIDTTGCSTTIVPCAMAIDTIMNAATCGQANGTIDLTVSGGSGVYQYLWSTGDTTSALSALAGGTYNATVTDNAGCKDSISISLPQTPALSATIITQNDSCDQRIGSALINISSGTPPYTYVWTPAGTNASMLDSGIYSVVITDNAGCSVAKTFSISDINNNCQPPLIIFPTAFTPNGDGKNDVFGAIYTPGLDEYQMTIYDRWGQLIFEAFDYTEVWDGTYKNVPQPIGVYVWFAKYNFINRPQQSQTGNITLLR